MLQMPRLLKKMDVISFANDGTPWQSQWLFPIEMIRGRTIEKANFECFLGYLPMREESVSNLLILGMHHSLLLRLSLA
jgi:hypothetical protein